MGSVIAFPGVSTGQLAETTPVRQGRASTELSYVTVQDFVYCPLPPTEGWWPYLYLKWFAERGTPLPRAAVHYLEGKHAFEPTTKTEYLVGMVPTLQHKREHRSLKNFEIFAARQLRLHEMPMESVFWMIRTLSMCVLPEELTWMLGVHAPIVVGGIEYRLNYGKTPDSESHHGEPPVVSEYDIRSVEPLNPYGAVCFISQ